MNDEWLVSVEDISALVRENRGVEKAKLMTPQERVYPVSAPARSAS